VDCEGQLIIANRAAAELRVDLQTIADAYHGKTSEVRLVDRTGAARLVAIQGKSRDGRRVVALRDLTEQREREDGRRQLRRIDSLGYVTASVVHDFNNLLTPIVCNSAALADQLDPASPAGEMAADVHGAAERAVQLVRQVLALARRPSCQSQ